MAGNTERMLEDSCRKRLYNMDALRILSMLFVCILHIAGTYGGMATVEGNFGKGLLAFVITLADVAVNCFVMLTGYVAGGRPWKSGRYLRLWCQVALYCVGFAVIGECISYGSTGHGMMTWRLFWEWNMPVPFASAYWYFVAYTALFILAPFIDRLISVLTRTQFTRLVIGTVGVIVLLTILPPYHGKVCGYSVYWMVCMYVLGCYFRMYPLKIRPVYGWFGVLGCGIAGTGSFIVSLYGMKHGWEIPNFGVGYTMPFVVIESVLLINLFARLQIRGEILRKVITWLAPLSFGVYLIHEHPAVSGYIRQACAGVYSVVGCNFVTVMLAAVATYMLASCVDFVRFSIFRIIGVDRFAMKAGETLDMLAKRLLNIISR